MKRKEWEGREGRKRGKGEEWDGGKRETGAERREGTGRRMGGDEEAEREIVRGNGENMKLPRVTQTTAYVHTNTYLITQFLQDGRSHDA